MKRFYVQWVNKRETAETGKRGLNTWVKPLIVVMLAISFFSNLGYYWDWHRTKTFKVRDMSVEMGDKLENAYIGGMTSTVAVLENKHKALWLYPKFVNWDSDTFEKYPMTHALLGTDVSKEVVHFFRQWPERMAQAPLLKVYHIKDYFLHFYSFTDPYISSAKPEEDGLFRLTLMNPSQKTVPVRIGHIVQD
ncbi:MAG: hypothetical protein GY940_47075, partial [bacterium]|nr:hypothetical protein [bacterium]